MDPEAAGSQIRTILFGTLRGERGEAAPPREREAVVASVMAHGGRLHDAAPDSVVASFGTSKAAIECAIELQRMRWVGEPDPNIHRFAFGVHRGQVEFDSGCVRGGAVDVAARLERLSDPGGICISGSIRKELADVMPMHTIDIGVRDDESAGGPIAVHRLIIDESLLQPAAVTPMFDHRPLAAWAAAVLLLIGSIGGLGFWFGSESSHLGESVASVAARPPEPGGVGTVLRPTIVVIPFQPHDSGAGENVFAGAVSEAIESELLVVTGVQVVVPPPHSGFGAHSARNLEITRDLGARYALEGRVERTGSARPGDESEAVVVVAELFDAQNGFRHFRAQYERSLGELPEIRRAIRERVLAVLEVDVSTRERAQPTVDQPSTRSSQTSRQ